MEKEMRQALGDATVDQMKALARKLRDEGKSPDEIRTYLNHTFFKGSVNTGIVDAVAPPVATAATTALVG